MALKQCQNMICKANRFKGTSSWKDVCLQEKKFRKTWLRGPAGAIASCLTTAEQYYQTDQLNESFNFPFSESVFLFLLQMIKAMTQRNQHLDLLQPKAKLLSWSTCTVCTSKFHQNLPPSVAPHPASSTALEGLPLPGFGKSLCFQEGLGAAME